jgi:hypothetical protein
MSQQPMLSNRIPLYQRLIFTSALVVTLTVSAQAQLSMTGCTGGVSLGMTCTYTVSGSTGASIVWTVSNGQFEFANQPGFTPTAHSTPDTSITVRFTRGPQWNAGQATVTATQGSQSASIATAYACYGPMDLNVVADTVRGKEGQPVRISAQLAGNWNASFPTGYTQLLPHRWEARPSSNATWQTVVERPAGMGNEISTGFFNGLAYVDSTRNAGSYSHLWFTSPTLALQHWEFRKTTERCSSVPLLSNGTTVLHLSGLDLTNAIQLDRRAWISGEYLHAEGIQNPRLCLLFGADGRRLFLPPCAPTEQGNGLWAVSDLAPGVYWLYTAPDETPMRFVR